MAIIFSGVAIVFYHWTCMYKMAILACRSAGAFALLEVAAQRSLGTQSTFGHVVCAKGGKTFFPLGTCVSQVVVKVDRKTIAKISPRKFTQGGDKSCSASSSLLLYGLLAHGTNRHLMLQTRINKK